MISIPNLSEPNASPFGPPGKVFLVGAGPGSPDLITRRGWKCLQTADAVLHDSLISPELLKEARVDAKILSVGKRGYCIGSTRQESIHDALIRLARMGLQVCRLKCGDPCLFGRGGEEAECLAAEGIPFEIIPGVTSALGGCAGAFIPLTHRNVGQSVTFVTGHHDPDSPECPLDWPVLARLQTLAFYMGARNFARIARKLQSSGMDSSMPVAVIESATLPGQMVHISTLADLQKSPPAIAGGPALLIVGKVVDYRDSLLNPTLKSLLPACAENLFEEGVLA